MFRVLAIGVEPQPTPETRLSDELIFRHAIDEVRFVFELVGCVDSVAIEQYIAGVRDDDIRDGTQRSDREFNRESRRWRSGAASAVAGRA